jgi:hypothetical protein
VLHLWITMKFATVHSPTSYDNHPDTLCNPTSSVDISATLCSYVALPHLLIILQGLCSSTSFVDIYILVCSPAKSANTLRHFLAMPHLFCQSTTQWSPATSTTHPAKRCNHVTSTCRGGRSANESRLSLICS